MSQTVSSSRPSHAPAKDKRRRNPIAWLSLRMREIVAELRKVIWPTRQELITYTAVSVVFVVFMIAFVFLLDYAFTKGMLGLFG